MRLEPIWFKMARSSSSTRLHLQKPFFRRSHILRIKVGMDITHMCLVFGFFGLTQRSETGKRRATHTSNAKCQRTVTSVGKGGSSHRQMHSQLRGHISKEKYRRQLDYSLPRARNEQVFASCFPDGRLGRSLLMSERRMRANGTDARFLQWPPRAGSDSDFSDRDEACGLALLNRKDGYIQGKASDMDSTLWRQHQLRYSLWGVEDTERTNASPHLLYAMAVYKAGTKSSAHTILFKPMAHP